MFCPTKNQKKLQNDVQMSKPYRRPQQQKGYQRNKKFQKKNRKPSFDQLLRAFKKKVERDGIIQEVRRRQYYVKPSELRQKKINDKKRKIQLQKIREAEAEMRRKQTSIW